MHHLHLKSMFDVLDVVALHSHHSGYSLIHTILPRGLRHVLSPCCPCSPFPVPCMLFVWCQWWPFIVLVIMALSIFPVHHHHHSSLHECSLIVKKNC